MGWVVLKFGGTSVSTAPRWRCICRRVQGVLAEDGHRVWVVISALTQVTNRLTAALDEAVSGSQHLQSYFHIFEQHMQLAVEVGLVSPAEASGIVTAEQSAAWTDAVSPSLLQPLVLEFHHLRRVLDGIRLTEEASPRLKARVLAFGELLSTHLGLEIMRHEGLAQVTRVDARQVLRSDPAPSEIDRYLEASVRPSTDNDGTVATVAGDAPVVLTQGFIAGAPAATGIETCVLGRGGSDTSGALFAALLGAARYEIWTDVHGMYTSDPRFVPHARLLKSLDYREAQELAAMGAKVLHPRCIGPAHWANVPVEIRNTNDPDGEKTVIGHSDDDARAKIMAVVRRLNMTLVTITAYGMCGTSGFLSKVFLPFEQHGISVDLIATSQFSVSVTLDHVPGGVDGAAFGALVAALEKLGAVAVVGPCATVSVVGRHLRTSLGELGPVFRLLEGTEVLLLSESAEDLNLSFVVSEADADGLVAKMHAALFPPMEEDTALPTLSYLRSPSRDALLGSSYSALLSSPRGFSL
ncbi:aspartokinase [Achlya hypogyna]|uniref:Aspartokinase n=1 Tax=Achlya hypogyna TaxID=1202772 RepID=A0A1V9YRI9_ACHHY|nr:aspartokinase [Achlya hypogyna]